jgi:hypothetical protein
MLTGTAITKFFIPDNCQLSARVFDVGFLVVYIRQRECMHFYLPGATPHACRLGHSENQTGAGKFPAPVVKRAAKLYLRIRRARTKPSRPNPASAHVVGSGVGVTSAQVVPIRRLSTK